MTSSAQTALREKAGRMSPIWFVPIVAALIGIWMAWHSYSTRGSLITITMETAEGIEAGKTEIRARNVTVGRVEKVRLSDAFDHIILTARMTPEASILLREDTQFWVVKPRIGRAGVSGLTTVLSGAFIQLQPGKATEPRAEFIALEQPPTTPQGAEGLRIHLVGRQAEAASTGDPVSFQGFDVGRVESAEFDVSTRQHHYRLFIRPPYDRLVTTNTRFWSRSGVSMNLTSEGVSVEMSSLEGLLGGGIAFGVPAGFSPGEPAIPDSRYVLYANADDARQGSFDRHLSYLLMIEDTVRGLRPGAPVEFRGVRVGTVAEVPYQFLQASVSTLARAAIPVLIHIEPQRLGALGGMADDEAWRLRFADLAADGLRASLKSGNLLTGALFVDLDFYPEPAPFQAGSLIDGIEEFPAVSTGFAQLEQKVSRLLDKLNDLPLESLLTNLDGRLQDAHAVLARLERITAHLDSALGSAETQALPSAMLGSLQELQATLATLSGTSAGSDGLAGVLNRLDRLMSDLQPLLRTLNDRPNALLFDRRNAADPQPEAPKP